MNKIFITILGIALIGFGIGIIINPVFYDSKHSVLYDFGQVKYEFGTILIMIGVYYAVYGVRKIVKDLKKK